MSDKIDALWNAYGALGEAKYDLKKAGMDSAENMIDNLRELIVERIDILGGTKDE